MEVNNSKHKPEDGDEVGSSFELQRNNRTREVEVDLLNVTLSLLNNVENAGDGFDTSFRTPQNGEEDNSKNGFARCSISLALFPSSNVKNARDEFGTSSHIPQNGKDDSGNYSARCSLSLSLNPTGNVQSVRDGSGTSSHIPQNEEDNLVNCIPHSWLSLALIPSTNAEDGPLFHQIGDDNLRNCIARCSRSDYSAIAQLNRSFYSLVNEKELFLLRRQLGNVEHWIYFACRLREWEVFDPIRLRRKHLPIVPSSELFSTSDKESLAVGTNLLLFWKDVITQLIYKYSLLTNTWTIARKMNTPRYLFGCAAFGGKAIVAGGCNLWGHLFSNAELYDSDTETWETLPSMNIARRKSTGVFMDGKFYVIGGVGVQNNPLTCGEVYDLEAQTWTVIPDMHPLRNAENVEPGALNYSLSGAPPLLAVVNNDLYAADCELEVVKKYNKVSNSWDTLGRLPETSDSMYGWGIAFQGCGDKLIVIGGPKNSEGGYVEVNCWVPSDGPCQWNVLARRPSNSFVYNCAIMGC